MVNCVISGETNARSCHSKASILSFVHFDIGQYFLAANRIIVLDLDSYNGNICHLSLSHIWKANAVKRAAPYFFEAFESKPPSAHHYSSGGK